MIYDYTNRLFEGILYGCMTTASSWCDCPTAPPITAALNNKKRCFKRLKSRSYSLVKKGTVVASKDRYAAVSYGFVNLYTSHPTHIPYIPSVTS